VKSGGRVMKNVTGYDLVKFLAGSYGTLAVFSEVTFKVLPIPETEATLVLAGLDDARAVAALSAALGSPFSVTGAAHVPGDPARTCIRIEGFAGLGRRPRAAAGGAIGLFRRGRAFWTRGVRRPLGIDPRPRRTRRRARRSHLARLGQAHRGSEGRRSGSPRVPDPHPLRLGRRSRLDRRRGGRRCRRRVVRAAVAESGGHATLVRAPDDVRLAVDVFQPQPPPVMDLTRKLKASFDPAGILNPGRMYPGI
jgi:glycolate oxidase FAD binding subunit